MHPRKFALYGGILMIAIGVLAMIPALSTDPLTAGLVPLQLETSHGLFLGLFAMNVMNKVALIVLGLLGVMAANAKGTSLPASISYSRWIMFVSGALAILGLIPATNTLFGYWPLYGYNVVFAVIVAAIGAYFGYALSSKVPDPDPTPRATRESLTGMPRSV